MAKSPKTTEEHSELFLNDKPLIKPFIDKEKEIINSITKNNDFFYKYFTHTLVVKEGNSYYYRVNFYRKDKDSLFEQGIIFKSKFIK